MTTGTATSSVDHTAADARATTVLLAAASLPAGDPRRPGLRAQAITAWMPMAHRLARRFSAPVSADSTLRLGDTLGDDDQHYEDTELRLDLARALRCLSIREQRVVSLVLLRRLHTGGGRSSDRRVPVCRREHLLLGLRRVRDGPRRRAGVR